MLRLIAGLMLLCLPLASLQAETRYVKDVIVIELRAAASSGAERLGYVRTGDRLEVFEVDGDFIRMRTAEGLEGWVFERYTVNEPIAALRLDRALSAMEKAKQDKEDAQSKVSDLQKELRTLQSEHKQVISEKQKLEQENTRIKEASAHPLELAEANEKMSRELGVANKELEYLRQQNQSLENGEARDWFLIGAGVLVIGLLVGLFVPNLNLRRRSEWV